MAVRPTATVPPPAAEVIREVGTAAIHEAGIGRDDSTRPQGGRHEASIATDVASGVDALVCTREGEGGWGSITGGMLGEHAARSTV